MLQNIFEPNTDLFLKETEDEKRCSDKTSRGRYDNREWIKERNRKQKKKWKKQVGADYDKRKRNSFGSLSLFFILRSSKTNAVLLRHCYQHWWDTYTHTLLHPAGRQALCYPFLNQSNDILETETDRWREKKRLSQREMKKTDDRNGKSKEITQIVLKICRGKTTAGLMPVIL